MTVTTKTVHPIMTLRNLLSLAIALVLTAFVGLPAQALDTVAKQAIILDGETGTVLYEKNADVPAPPSSMSKLMTVLVVMDRLAEGSLSLDDKFLVSEKAWKMGGSKMFVMVNKRISVEDLLRGIIVQSGNDACIVVAEGIAGTEAEFAHLLNERAKEIGLTNSHFVNATGWPHEGQFMSVRDLATLAQYIHDTYPDYYKMFGEKEFTWAKIKQGNRNPLLYRDIGADGLKTGHTEAGGYALTASAIQGDRRIFMVLNGMGSMRERSSESLRLMGWAFRNFDNYHLFDANETVGEADVWLGTEETVPVIVPEALTLTMKRQSRRNMKVAMSYTAPIPAPIVEGQQVGVLRVTAPDMDPLEYPLLAGKSVYKLGAVGRLQAAVSYLLWGAGGR